MITVLTKILFFLMGLAIYYFLWKVIGFELTVLVGIVNIIMIQFEENINP